MAIHFLGSENCFLLSFSYFSSWETQSCMPVSVDGLMAGGKGSLREENWRSGARFSDCCRRWADSKWKAQLRMKPTLNVGHRVGTEARNGAINEGLNADPWHCLFLKKKKKSSTLSLFQQVIYLGPSAQPAEWKVRPRKRKSWITRGCVTCPGSNRKVQYCQSWQGPELSGFLLTALAFGWVIVLGSISDTYFMARD